MQQDPSELSDRIRDILLKDWDPTGASRAEAACTEYDAYIPPLLELLRSEADEDAIISFLHEREKEIMCFPSLGTARLRPAARKLLRLRQPS